MDNFELLKNDLSFTIGKLNGIHMLLVTIARFLPPEVAAACAQELTRTIELAEADLIALPISDIAIQENIRVVRECLLVLQNAAEQSR